MEKNNKIKETNPYSNKNTINKFEKKSSFHTINNPIRSKFHFSHNSSISKDLSNHLLI